MKIISTLGGGGSTFVLEALDRKNYSNALLGSDPYQMRNRLMQRSPALRGPFDLLVGLLGAYQPRLKVLMRPDAFWTDRGFHETATYDPDGASYRQDLRAQKMYIVRTRHRRSAGIRISPHELRDDTLAALVQSYVDKMESVESLGPFIIILVAGHWGEYGVFKQLGLETIYLIRDPYNSLISHSKSTRHEKDYLRRGLKHINTKAWIDTYLSGPHHYWINHARTALSHENATIVRYNHFAEDWQKVRGLPDITSEFSYHENKVTEILTAEAIDYVYQQTKDICKALGFKTPGRDTD